MNQTEKEATPGRNCTLGSLRSGAQAEAQQNKNNSLLNCKIGNDNYRKQEKEI